MTSDWSVWEPHGLLISHSPVNNQGKCSKPVRLCVYISLFVHGNDLLRSKSSSIKSEERSGSTLTLPPLTLQMWPTANGDLVDSGISAPPETATSHNKVWADSLANLLLRKVWQNLLLAVTRQIARVELEGTVCLDARCSWQGNVTSPALLLTSV